MTGMSPPLPEFLDFRRPTRYISRKGDAFALAEGGARAPSGRGDPRRGGMPSHRQRGKKPSH